MMVMVKPARGPVMDTDEGRDENFTALTVFPRAVLPQEFVRPKPDKLLPPRNV